MNRFHINIKQLKNKQVGERMRDALVTEYKLRDLLVAHVVDGSAPAPLQLQG